MSRHKSQQGKGSQESLCLVGKKVDELDGGADEHSYGCIEVNSIIAFMLSSFQTPENSQHN